MHCMETKHHETTHYKAGYTANIGDNSHDRDSILCRKGNTLYEKTNAMHMSGDNRSYGTDNSLYWKSNTLYCKTKTKISHGGDI